MSSWNSYFVVNFATFNKGRIPGKLTISNSLVQFIHQTAFRWTSILIRPKNHGESLLNRHTSLKKSPSRLSGAKDIWAESWDSSGKRKCRESVRLNYASQFSLIFTALCFRKGSEDKWSRNCLAWPSWVVSLMPANHILYANLGKLACVADETRLQRRLGKKFTCLLLIEITRSKASVLLQSACSRFHPSLFYQYDHRLTTLLCSWFI